MGFFTNWFCGSRLQVEFRSMERASVHAIFFLFLIICFAGITASTQVALEKELEVSLDSAANKHHKHKHSGFSQAECPGACTYRCSKTQHKKPCTLFCQKCCFKCRCVPPGTYAHKEVCPCYNNWKTKSGGPKCP